MKRRLFQAGVLALAVVAISSCQDSGPKKKRFAYVTNGVAEFWTLAQTGAEQAALDLGVEVSVLMPGSLSDQKQMLEDSLTRGVNGIAVSPIDPSNQTDLLNSVAAAAALITHDSDAPESERQAYIGMDNYVAGRLCGELIKEALPDGGEIMILIGRMEQDNSRKRRQGVIDELLGRPEDSTRFDPPGAVIKGGEYTVLGTLTDGFDLAKAKANAEDALSRHPGIDAMVGLFAYNPPAILQALEQAGKLGEVKVIGFDEDEQTLAGIQAGSVHGTVVQNPYEYGYQSVRLLNQLSAGDVSALSDGEFIQIPGRQIRKDNVDAFWADIKVKLGKE
tara:strand:- start:258 stop:1259 length:1002 start_codon:yes stop_codon:yes gene_type:complete